MNTIITQPTLSDEIFESAYERIFEGRLPLSEVSIHLDYAQEFIQKPSPEFIASIQEFGVIYPIILNQTNEDPPIYWIHAGKRRYQAAKLTEQVDIPVIIVKTTGIAGEALTLTENYQRSHNPLEELNAILSIEEKTSDNPKDDKTLAKALGIPVQKIRKLRPIGNLPSETINHLQAGKIALGTAEKLAKKSARVINEINKAITDNPDEQITWKMVKHHLEVDQISEMQKFEEMIDQQARELTAPDPALIDNLIDFYLPEIKNHEEGYYLRGARKLVNHVLTKGIYYDGTEA